jgi:lipoyl(octanoyl) transferase
VQHINLIKAGLSDYRQIWKLQNRLFKKVVDHRDQHYLILTEHHPVITIGKSGNRNNLIASEAHLKSIGIDTIDIDRGGDITFHGPGQMVGYPILNLYKFKKDIHWYLRALEDVIIRTISEFGITGLREQGLTGVWVGSRKICALGVNVTRWVTKHGFALNIHTNLNYFDHIIPCGISDRGVTSISQLTGNIIPVKDVSNILLRHFENVFSVTFGEDLSENILREFHV